MHLLNIASFNRPNNSNNVSFGIRMHPGKIHPKNMLSINLDEINLLNIKNLRVINNRIISGGTFESRSLAELLKLKRSGVDVIVDFRGDGGDELLRKCKRAKLEYFKFPLDDLLHLVQGKFFHHIPNQRMQVDDEFVAQLKKYFEITTNKKAYVGCHYGIDRTNIGLAIDYLLNPKSEHSAPQLLVWPGERRKTVVNKNTKIIKKILRSLSEEQKRFLGLSTTDNNFTNSRILRLVHRNSRQFDTLA